MKQNINEVEINGTIYVPKTAQTQQLPLSDVVLVRTRSAGIFYGEISESNFKEGWLKLKNARRVWYWTGAASLSQLAMEGTISPETCKFPMPVSSIVLFEVIEIIPCTEKAVFLLNSVTIWKM